MSVWRIENLLDGCFMTFLNKDRCAQSGHGANAADVVVMKMCYRGVFDRLVRDLGRDGLRKCAGLYCQIRSLHDGNIRGELHNQTVMPESLCLPYAVGHFYQL